MVLETNSISQPVTLLSKNGTTSDKRVTKQTKYYHNHKNERLAYQKKYYQQHKQAINANRKQRIDNKRVQRAQETISVIHNICLRAKCDLRREEDLNPEVRKVFLDSCFHVHGRRRKHYALSKHLAFHLVPQLWWNPFSKTVQYKRWLFENDCIPARDLQREITRFLGLKVGDSFVWKEEDKKGKVRTHLLYFDRSGLDMAYSGDLSRLVQFRTDTGLKGYELLQLFTQRYSECGYLRVFRGNRLIATSQDNQTN